MTRVCKSRRLYPAAYLTFPPDWDMDSPAKATQAEGGALGRSPFSEQWPEHLAPFAYPG